MKILDCILLIDDEPTSLFISKKVIKNLMISRDVATATNGCEGMEYINKYFLDNEKMPDLVFLDINMPVCDGFDFMNFVKEKFPQLTDSIVVLSTSSHPKDKEKMNELGIKHYITKPITLDKLNKFLAADSHIPFHL